MIEEFRGLHIPVEQYAELKNEINLICDELRRCELPVSLASAIKLQALIQDPTNVECLPGTTLECKMLRLPPLQATQCKAFVVSLTNRLQDELSTKIVMFLPYHRASYYSNPGTVFTEDVRDCFPSAIYDMDEACKCFALARYTASVFHLMRIMEVGLNLLGNSLDLPIAKSWGSAILNIEKEITLRNTGSNGHKWKENEKPFFVEAATHFRVVKDAWRNHTMHTKDKFDEERAKDILNSVVAFMRHLVTRLHE
jgi:hypothetical protein